MAGGLILEIEAFVQMILITCIWSGVFPRRLIDGYEITFLNLFVS